jgi:hypothetical protein
MPNDAKDVKGGTSWEFAKEAERAPQQRHPAAQTGEVDEEQANRWFAQHWPEKRRLCSVCGQNDWDLSHKLFRCRWVRWVCIYDRAFSPALASRAAIALIRSFLTPLLWGSCQKAGNSSMAEPQYAKLQAEYTVALPQDTLSVVVYMNTWVRLKDRVRKCRHGVGIWERLLWTMVGVFITSAVSAFKDYRSARYFSITP